MTPVSKRVVTVGGKSSLLAGRKLMYTVHVDPGPAKGSHLP